jgi:hypothetical protein
VAGGLENTDSVMRRGFFVGVYPGLGGPQLDHITAQFEGLFRPHMGH